ncbi:class I SAM-dependent methyltransferase [Microlunatus speluncae]|uniref:class I SAM-dependent methyltransferase n=1 Tax=Microlunatus speluncae TaxID=2594267 RepID=UPI001266752E|nr:class I SAM-dependent methyltransferase [Microlunatus speluncae]
MSTDAITGWDEDANAEAYAAFARSWPMYSASSRDLVDRAQVSDSRLVVDMCGGTGTTAEAILNRVSTQARVISLDSSAAMQHAGQRALNDERLSWVTASAEDLAEHAPAGNVDAVVCNSAIWKCDVPAVFKAVCRVLRPGGRFAFNVGASFAGLTHPDDQNEDSRRSLDSLIRRIAIKDYGFIPPAVNNEQPKLPKEAISRHLADAGIRLESTCITAQRTTMAERRAWLSIPLFARPDNGFTYAQKMHILEEAYSQVSPEEITMTRWLVIVAQV